MHARSAYIRSFGVTGILVGAALIMLAIVGAIVAFNGWPSSASAAVDPIAIDVSAPDTTSPEPTVVQVRSARAAGRPALAAVRQRRQSPPEVVDGPGPTEPSGPASPSAPAPTAASDPKPPARTDPAPLPSEPLAPEAPQAPQVLDPSTPVLDPSTPGNTLAAVTGTVQALTSAVLPGQSTP